MPLLAVRKAPSAGTILGFGVAVVGAVASAAVIVMELRRPGASLLHSFQVRHIVWAELGVFVLMAQQLWDHARTLRHGADAEDSADVDQSRLDIDVDEMNDSIAFFGPVVAFYDADEADLTDGPAEGRDADADDEKTDRDSSA